MRIPYPLDMRRVILFTRVSSANQSLKRQVDELSTYAKSNDYKVVAIIKETISGTVKNTNRTGIQELMSIIDKEDIDEVVVHELSRLGRDSGEVLSVSNHLHERGISLHLFNFNLSSLNEDGTINPLASIVFGVIGQFSQMEVQGIRSRVKSGVQKKIKDNLKKKNWSWGRKVGSTESKEVFLKKHKQVVHFLSSTELSIRQISKLCEKSLQTVLKVKKVLELA